MEADPRVRRARSRERAAELRLELRFPMRGAFSADPVAVGPVESGAWLAELREFRGRVAWNGGQRPAFRLPDGTFGDSEPHDIAAYHLILRDPLSGQIAGCVRYAPLENLACSRIRELAAATAAEIITRAGRTDADVLEGARLMVRGWAGRAPGRGGSPAWPRRGAT